MLLIFVLSPVFTALAPFAHCFGDISGLAEQGDSLDAMPLGVFLDDRFVHAQSVRFDSYSDSLLRRLQLEHPDFTWCERSLELFQLYIDSEQCQPEFGVRVCRHLKVAIELLVDQSLARFNKSYCHCAFERQFKQPRKLPMFAVGSSVAVAL